MEQLHAIAIKRLCHNLWDASDVNGVMELAAEGCHEANIWLCHDEWGAAKVEAVNTAMAKATKRSCGCVTTSGTRLKLIWLWKEATKRSCGCAMTSGALPYRPMIIIRIFLNYTAPIHKILNDGLHIY